MESRLSANSVNVLEKNSERNAFSSILKFIGTCNMPAIWTGRIDNKQYDRL